MRRHSRKLLIVLILTFLAACSSSPPESKRIRVTASIFPLADIVRSLGGDRVQVDVLIPAGASPHVFEPTPEAFRRFVQTRLFVMVGAGMEFWAEKLITATAEDDLVVVRATDGIQLLPWQEHHQGSEIDDIQSNSGIHQIQPQDQHLIHGQPQGPGGNPHVWLDPLLARDLAERISLQLARLDPTHAEDYERRLANYQARLADLDRKIAETVEGFRLKEYVAFHPAWSYFAKRYGLREVGIIQESPGRDPTPRQVESIVQDIKRYGIKAVFAEPQYSQAAAEAIAQEAGARVLLLDPLGGPNLPGRDSYIGLLEYNLQIMREAMK